MVNKHNIDPLVIMDVDELRIQLDRVEKQGLIKRKKESGEQFRQRLIAVGFISFIGNSGPMILHYDMAC